MDLFDSLVKMVSSLAVVVALMILVAAAARRWLKPGLGSGLPFTKLQLTSSLTLGGRRSVLVLDVAGRTLVIGATPQQLILLTQFDSDAARVDFSGNTSQPAGNTNRSIDCELRETPETRTNGVPVDVRVNEAIRNHRAGALMRSGS
jgi:flagellar biogenesis protein FliO